MAKSCLKDHKVFRWVGFSILCVYAFTLIFSLGWAFFSSLKDSYEFTDNVFGMPKDWLFSNYNLAFNNLFIKVNNRKFTLIYLIFNSLWYAGLYTILPLFANIVVAYGCARYKSKVGSIIKAMVILRMVIPIVGGLASGLTIAKFIGTYDNIPLAALFQFTPQGAHFLIFIATFEGISKEYSEAAFIDGAGHMRVFVTIMLPLVRNTIIALGIMQFIGCWNDWQSAMVWFPSTPTIAYALYLFDNSSANAISSIPLKLAACVVTAIPMLVIFVAFKDKLVGNLAMGGLKG